MDATIDVRIDHLSTLTTESCAGPDTAGRCPRAAVGDAVACAGCLIGSPDGSACYLVGAGMTICPFTLAQAMDIPPDEEYWLERSAV